MNYYIVTSVNLYKSKKVYDNDSKNITRYMKI